MRPNIQLEPAAGRDAMPAGGGDATLVERCRRGESAAFAQLVRKYQDRVFNTCWRMCGNRTDAEDFTQEAFVKALQGIDRFTGRAQFYTWVFRIAVNTVLSALRRKRLATAVSLDDPPHADGRADDGRPAWQSAADDPLPDDEASHRERQALVRQALDRLDEQQRAIVILRDMESLDYAEIAEILEVPVGTVKSRLHRARLALADLLGPVLYETDGHGT